MAKPKPKQSSDDPIPESLRHLSFPVAELQPDPANARQHGERNIEAVVASLRAFGWRGVVVAHKDTKQIIAGHGRVEAAKLLGWSHAPVHFVDDDKAKAMAFALADNRTAELATWDWEQLTDNLRELASADAALIGWSQQDLDNLFAPGGTEEAQELDVDSVPAYDPKTDTRSIKVVGIAQEDGQRVADVLQAALDAAALPYKVILH
jgi:hypothetical protein